MKIRHGIILSVALFIGALILNNDYIPIDFRLKQSIVIIVLMLWLVSLGLITYLIIRTIFRAIKGTVTGTPQSGDYRSEARRACESVTPKRKKDTTPPWEE